MDDFKEPKIVISNAAKREYLTSLIGKMHKILHLFEEEAETGFSPRFFIAGQLWEMNAANELFDGKLVPVIVKVKGVYEDSKNIEYREVKKQIFEIDKIIKSMLCSLK